MLILTAFFLFYEALLQNHFIGECKNKKPGISKKEKSIIFPVKLLLVLGICLCIFIFKYFSFKFFVIAFVYSMVVMGSHGADLLWHVAEKANYISGRYSLIAVVFSLIMFLGATATKLANVRLSGLLILISGFVCATTVLLVLVYMPLAIG